MEKQMMVIFVIIALVAVSVGCSKIKSNKQIINENSKQIENDNGKGKGKGIQELILNLEKLGYYKYSQPLKIEEIKKQCIKTGYVYGWEETCRDFMTDAESLAEGGFEEFSKEINVFMEKQQMKLEVADVIYSENLYSVKVNNISYEILKGDELKKKNWELATDRSFSIINKLLKDKGSTERLYKLYGGNDLRAVFLTEEMYNEIKNYKDLSDKEKPRNVTDMFK